MNWKIIDCVSIEIPPFLISAPVRTVDGDKIMILSLIIAKKSGFENSYSMEVQDFMKKNFRVILKALIGKTLISWRMIVNDLFFTGMGRRRDR